MSPGKPFLSLSLLILAAGLALVGCSDDSSTTTPAPAPAPPTPPAPPAPDPVGVPGGLKVTATGSDFLEFGWEAVEGATGYEIQMSLTEGDWTSVDTATVTTTTRRFPVAAETTGYARVRAHEGERQSAWSETAAGTSRAAPLVLAAPSPRVKGAGPDFIEWEWDAVADALAYEVRVATTVAGLDAAAPRITAETMHRVTAEPDMEMYLRVRAAAGTPESPVVSDWSEAVAGMSEAAPTPFVVSMAPPGADGDSECSGQVFCPDSGTDPETARASVNPKMVVSLSDPARIRPLFVEGAAGVPVEAGEGTTPFAYRDWSALQAAVVRDGVTFEFRRMTAGAGQEAMPTGDTRYITCGPFRCSEAAAETPEAPEMTTDDAAVCEEFEVDFKLIKGIEDNRYVFYWTSDSWRRSGGLDAGWEYTLSHPAELTHEFTDIPTDSPTGTMTVKGAPLKVTSKPRALCMGVSHTNRICREVPSLLLPTDTTNRFGGVRNQDGFWDTFADPYPILNGHGTRPIDCWLPTVENFEDSGASWLVSYQRIVRSLGEDRPDVRLKIPDSCFRLITAGWTDADPPQNTAREIQFRNHVPGYRLHVDPLVGVSWAGSEVAWGDDDPFADLRCERVTFQVSDQYDFCEDFQAEARNYWGNGIAAGGQFQVEYRLSGSDNTDGKVTEILVRNKAPMDNDTWRTGEEYRPLGSRMGHLWLVRDDPGTPNNTAIDGTKRDWDVYRLRSGGWEDHRIAAREQVNSVVDWRPIMSVELEDADGDPLYGDFGKIDMANAAGDRGSDGDPENFDGNADADFCTDDDGPGCDSVQDFDLSATFTYLRDTDICTWTAELPLTCTWDADGDGHRRGDTAFDDRHENGTNLFVRCEAR